MSKANSPTYAQGLQDGMADRVAIESCPPRQPVGPNPPFPAYPVMYMHGYNEAFEGAEWHSCSAKCARQVA